VCPPDTISARTGNSTSSAWSLNHNEYICPSRWFIPSNGICLPNAMPLAVFIPTRREPINPGPRVTATADISSRLTCASDRAVVTIL
jgi:hypothetical protein